MRFVLLLPLLPWAALLAQGPECGPLMGQRARCRLAPGPLPTTLTLPLGRAEKLRGTKQPGYEVWHGRLAGQPGSAVTLVAADGHWQGSVQMESGEWYTLRTEASGEGELARAEIPANVTSESELVPPAAAEAVMGAPAVTAGGSVLDILAVYTPSARAGAGGETALRARIALALAETNQAFANSRVGITLRLADVVEYAPALPLPEAASLAWLEALTADPALSSLRDRAGADLVSVWIHGAGAEGGIVGYSWTLRPPFAAFAANALHIVEQNFATAPVSTFAHELGHNLGAVHDRRNASGPGAFPYSYGYQSPAGRFYDLMAYSNGCAGCVRKNYYANPAVFFDGYAGGVPAPAADAADLALTFEQTRSAVEQFRTPPVDAPAGPSIESFGANPARIIAGETVTLSWDARGAAGLLLTPYGDVTGRTSLALAPSATTRYTLTATGINGATVHRTIDVTVDPAPSPLAAPSLSFAGGGSFVLPAGQPVNLAPVSRGGAVTYCSATPALPSGISLSSACHLSGTPALAQGATSYWLYYGNAAGGRLLALTLTVTAAPPGGTPAPVITSFTASPAVIAAGQATALMWSALNAVSLSLSGVGPVTGQTRAVTPAASTVFVLTAVNAAGVSTSASVTVTVLPPGVSPAVSFVSPQSGQAVSGVWYFTLAVPASVSYARATLTIGDGPPYPLYSSAAGQVSTGVNTAGLASGTHVAVAELVDRQGVQTRAVVAFRKTAPDALSTVLVQ